jgi:hypothetical protein
MVDDLDKATPFNLDAIPCHSTSSLDHMGPLPAFFSVVPGMFVGIACLPFFTHWMALLFAALGKPDPRKKSAPTNRLWLTIFTVIHPVPWLILLGLPFGIRRLLANPPTSPWLWFFGSAAISPLLLIALVFFRLRKIRKRVALIPTSGETK